MVVDECVNNVPDLHVLRSNTHRLRSTFMCSIFSVVMQLLTADGLFIQARKALVWVIVVLELVRQGSAVELFEFLAAIKGLGVQGLVPAKCRYLLFEYR